MLQGRLIFLFDESYQQHLIYKFEGWSWRKHSPWMARLCGYQGRVSGGAAENRKTAINDQTNGRWMAGTLPTTSAGHHGN